MNILEEYKRRNHLNFIPPYADGILFYKTVKSPNRYALLTSGHSRNRNYCLACGDKDKIVLEVFSLELMPNLVLHAHIHPNTDIDSFVKERIPSLKSVSFNSFRGAEIWLWNCFLCNLINSKFKSGLSSYIKSQKNMNALEASIDQMVWMSVNYNAWFEYFLVNYFSYFLLGRNYLLLK